MKPPMSRVRGATPQARALLDDAKRRSATIRELAGTIEDSDLIVYVELDLLANAGKARTWLVSATKEGRYLRISLGALTPPFDMLPLLAHELQHAVEIAEAPHIRDSASLRAHYLKIGEDPSAHSSFETADARRIQNKVRREFTRKD